MKKIIKLSKFLLLIATVFSYVSSPIAVLANEIATPVVITLDAVDADEDGIVDNYKLTYISEDPNDYEDEKNYTMKLVTTAVYTNGDEEILKENPGTTLVIDDDYELDDFNVKVYHHSDDVTKKYRKYMYEKFGNEYARDFLLG